MNPLKKAYTPAYLILEGAALTVLGILLLSSPLPTLTALYTLARWALLLLGLLTLVNAALKRRSSSTWVNGAGMLCMAGVILLFPKVLGGSMSVLFGLWSLLNALSKLLYAVQLKHDGQRGVAWAFLTGVGHALFAALLLTDPLGGLMPLTVLLGLYCILFGLTVLSDALREVLLLDVRGKRVKQHLRISPPILLTALLPLSLLRALDDPNEAEETARWTRRETNDADAAPDLEIFLHLSRSTALGMGHVDIALRDWVYSYGCYDAASSRLFGAISDGVLAEADRERYIPFCLEHEKKKLIGFGVTLTPEQAARVQAAATTLLTDSRLWLPPEGSTQSDFARDAGAVFHKLEHGPFKTYNVFKTNCVALADILCGASGLDLMNLQGIVTPGTYYAFLDRQFLRRNSIVISRTVYR